MTAMYKNTLRSIVRGSTSIANSAMHCLSILNRTVYRYDIRRSWVISGSPRSGTTWLAEILSHAEKNTRTLWEPLQDGNPYIKTLGFSARPFLKIDSVCEVDTHRFFEDALHGYILNQHTLRLRRYPSHVRYLFGNGRWIVKFVRGNGVLAYLNKFFDIPKPVVIIRHPCAVVASQCRMGRWLDHPHVDENLLELYPFIKEMAAGASSLEEKLAITWGCDVLAAKTYEDLLHTVYYEDLFLNGREVLSRIFENWGMDVPEACLLHLRKPSSSSRAWSVGGQEVDKLKEWQRYLAPEVIDKILHIVEGMGIDVYGRDPLPRTIG